MVLEQLTTKAGSEALGCSSGWASGCLVKVDPTIS